MKIKTNTGFSLVGTLAISLGTLTIVLGALKLNLNALNTAKIESTKVAEESLKQTVINILSNTDDCKENLKSGQIIDSTIQSSNEVIKPGLFNEVINIFDMKLQDDPDDSDKKLFYLYYSKPALGDKKTKGGNPCTKSNPKGCYYLSCEIDYKCTDNINCDDTGDKCNLKAQKCGFEGKINNNNQTCTTNKLRIRADINSCAEIPAATFFKGVNSKTEDGYIYGFAGFNENREPQFIKILKVCPTGQYPVKVMVENDEGENEVDIACKVMCTVGSILDGNECKCPEDTEYKAEQGRCVECQAGASRTETEPKCTCDNGVDAPICECPPEKPHIYQNKCIACPPRSSWDGDECICAGGKWWVFNKPFGTFTGINECRCQPREYSHNGRCIRCPPGSWGSLDKCICSNKTQEWVRSSNKCVCKKSGHYIYSGFCIRCPTGSSWNGNKCICTGGREWVFTVVDLYRNLNLPYPHHNTVKNVVLVNSCRCPTNRPHFHNDRCHNCTSQYFHNGGCQSCTRWYFHEGQCRSCRADYFYNHQCNICPSYQKHHFLGRCWHCPQNRSHYYNTQCHKCPRRQPHYYDNRCNKCPQNHYRFGNRCGRCPTTAPHYRDGKCCPSAQGNCCMPGYIYSRGRCQKYGIRCPEGFYNSNGRCCQNGWYNSNGYCCPEGQHFTNRACCPIGYYHTLGSGICCADAHVFSNGSCCWPGYTFDRVSKRCYRN